MLTNVIFVYLSLEFDILLQKKVLKVISHFHCPNGYVKDPFTAECRVKGRQKCLFFLSLSHHCTCLHKVKVMAVMNVSTYLPLLHTIYEINKE